MSIGMSRARRMGRRRGGFGAAWARGGGCCEPGAAHGVTGAASADFACWRIGGGSRRVSVRRFRVAGEGLNRHGLHDYLLALFAPGVEAIYGRGANGCFSWRAWRLRHEPAALPRGGLRHHVRNLAGGVDRRPSHRAARRRLRGRHIVGHQRRHGGPARLGQRYNQVLCAFSCCWGFISCCATWKRRPRYNLYQWIAFLAGFAPWR